MTQKTKRSGAGRVRRTDGRTSVAASIALTLFVIACSSNDKPDDGSRDDARDDSKQADSAHDSAPVDGAQASGRADVIAVEAAEAAGAYTFSVTVRSPDSGCDRYADWWEVLRPDGSLIYRRVLLHSHVAEQPFTRTGGPVGVAADDEVIVRAHMAPGGYGGAAMRGSPGGQFSATQLADGFAVDLAQQAPLPDGCDF